MLLPYACFVKLGRWMTVSLGVYRLAFYFFISVEVEMSNSLSFPTPLEYLSTHSCLPSFGHRECYYQQSLMSSHPTKISVLAWLLQFGMFAESILIGVWTLFCLWRYSLVSILSMLAACSSSFLNCLISRLWTGVCWKWRPSS